MLYMKTILLAITLLGMTQAAPANGSAISFDSAVTASKATDGPGSKRIFGVIFNAKNAANIKAASEKDPNLLPDFQKCVNAAANEDGKRVCKGQVKVKAKAVLGK